MKILQRCYALSLLLLLAATGSHAQTYAVTNPQLRADEGFNRVEVHGGIVYANLRLPGLSERRHSGGWGTSVTGYVSRHFGFTGDFAGQYSPRCADNDVDCILRELFSTQIVRFSSHQFMGGPRVRFGGERWSGFGHALFGGIRHRVTLLDTSTGERTVVKPGPQFAMAYGGGLDWNVGENIGVRLFQMDYIPVRDEPMWSHNFRIQGGVVFRFGRK